MTDAARRRILADMGIDVWRLRVAEVSETRSEPVPSAAAAPAVSPAAPAVAAVARPAEPAVPAPAEKASAVREPVRKPAAVPQERFSAVAIAVPGAVLLVADAPSKVEARLARDVLGAASGAWRARPVSRRFDWPPELGGESLAGDARSGDRALAAFVDKDLADHGARVLLCAEPLARRLPDRWAGCRRLVIPPLAVLGSDAGAKQALWSALAAEPPGGSDASGEGAS